MTAPNWFREFVGFWRPSSFGKPLDFQGKGFEIVCNDERFQFSKYATYALAKNKSAWKTLQLATMVSALTAKAISLFEKGISDIDTTNAVLQDAFDSQINDAKKITLADQLNDTFLAIENTMRDAESARKQASQQTIFIVKQLSVVVSTLTGVKPKLQGSERNHIDTDVTTVKNLIRKIEDDGLRAEAFKKPAREKLAKMRQLHTAILP